MPSRKDTWAGRGGRNTRRAMRGAWDSLPSERKAPGAKLTMTKAPGRWVSRSKGAPPRPVEVHSCRRAIVSARRSGEGCAGSSSENWTVRAGVGSARSVRAWIASRGGWTSRSRSRSVRHVRGSDEGAAGCSARRWTEPSTSASSKARETARRPRSTRRAQRGSSTRARMNDSGSSPSIGHSSSSVHAKH